MDERRLGSLGAILNYAFYWDATPEHHDYWEDMFIRWDEIEDKKLLEVLYPLMAPSFMFGYTGYDNSWKMHKGSILVKKLNILARYHDRFGEDAPIPLMIDLVFN